MPLSDKVCTVVVVGRRSADKRDVMGKTRALGDDVCENPLKAPFFQRMLDKYTVRYTTRVLMKISNEITSNKNYKK